MPEALYASQPAETYYLGEDIEVISGLVGRFRRALVQARGPVLLLVGARGVLQSASFRTIQMILSAYSFLHVYFSLEQYHLT